MTVPVSRAFGGMGTHHSAAAITDEWITPRFVIDALGPFDLDPCAAVGQPWPTAARHYTVEDDGLRQPWRGTVWLNPPYGRETWRWLTKLAAHGDGIALIFARTETAGFFAQAWERADAMLYLKGRLDFHRVDGSTNGNAGAPSVLLAYGVECVGRLERCDLEGALVTGWDLVRTGPPTLLDDEKGGFS